MAGIGCGAGGSVAEVPGRGRHRAGAGLGEADGRLAGLLISKAGFHRGDRREDHDLLAGRAAAPAPGGGHAGGVGSRIGVGMAVRPWPGRAAAIAEVPGPVGQAGAAGITEGDGQWGSSAAGRGAHGDRDRAGLARRLGRLCRRRVGCGRFGRCFRGRFCRGRQRRRFGGFLWRRFRGVFLGGGNLIMDDDGAEEYQQCHHAHQRWQGLFVSHRSDLCLYKFRIRWGCPFKRISMLGQRR